MREKDGDREHEETWPGGWLPTPYAVRCRQRQADLASRLARFIQHCGELPDISNIIVFGSYARNAISPWSDIDILVVRDAPADARSIDLVDDLYRAGIIAGDIIAIPTSRYPEGLEATPFGRTILSEGIRVYARPA